MNDDWYYRFKNRADECGLPVPDSPYKTAAVILGVIKAFTDVLKDMPNLLNRPLSQVAQVVFRKGAYDASVKQLIEKLASQGMKATARSMGTAGTAAGNVSLAGSILASAYVGGLIGCALYATDKAYFSGRMDDRLTDVSVRIWEWWYDVEAKRQEGQAMEAKLQMMRQLRGLAQQLGVRPSELAEKVLHGGQL